MGTIAPLLIIPLSAFIGIAFLRGQKKNRLIAANTASTLEEFFRPREKRYTNIGGVIGYHIQYQLSGKFRRLKGTLTLLPRQAILYLPISRLLGRCDQLRISLEGDALPLGEGHIVERTALERGRVFIENEEELHREREFVGGREFTILSYNPMVAERLRGFLCSLPTVQGLYGFSMSRIQKQYALVVDPERATFLPLIGGIESELRRLQLIYQA